MQGFQGCIVVAAGSLLLGFWSCTFPSYGFVDESRTRSGGGPGSQVGGAGDANGGEANTGTGGSPGLPDSSGGQAGEEPSTGASGTGTASGGAGGSIVQEVPAKRCEDFESEPTGCRCLDYHEHAYLFCDAARAWWEAGDECEAVGTKLLALQAAEENNWVVERIAELEGSLAVAFFWIGGSSEGDSWVFSWPDETPFWVGRDDGMPAEGGYANWRNTNPKQGGCVSMSQDGWEDGNCAELRPYLCEAY